MGLEKMGLYDTEILIPVEFTSLAYQQIGTRLSTYFNEITQSNLEGNQGEGRSEMGNGLNELPN